MGVILASTSPRRHEILRLLGFPFTVIAPGFQEIVGQRPVAEEVLDFALEKARSVAATNPQDIVIGSDTMISLDGEKFGKPTDLADARRMLQVFSGKTHGIYTSVAIIDGAGGPGLRTVEEVKVAMRAFSDEEIAAYLACGESLDKAGAYSIQGRGSRLIDSIRGDFLAAVGMPLKPIALYLRQRGLVFPLDVEELYRQKSFLNWRDF